MAAWVLRKNYMHHMFSFFLHSLFGALFPLPRIVYAMSSDGVIFRFLGKVSARFQTPVIGTLIAGILTG
jgi:amino acid transporter